MRERLRRLLAAASPWARADRRNIDALAVRHRLPRAEAERLYRRSRAVGFPKALAELERRQAAEGAARAGDATLDAHTREVPPGL